MANYSVLSLLLAAACTGDLGKDKVDAVAEGASASTEKAAQEPSSEAQSNVEWSVDASQSKISALGAKVVGKHPIDFHDYTGTIRTTGDQVSSIRFEIQMASLTTDHPKLQQHLLNEDFFWVEQFPTASFESAGVTAGSDQEGMTHTISGDLTVRGVSQMVRFPASIQVTGESVMARTEFVVNRQDFEITYPGKADNLVQDSVVLTIGLVASPSAP